MLTIAMVIGVAVTAGMGCSGDLDGDGSTSSADLNILLDAFGSSHEGDLSGDQVTNSIDLNILLADFGCVDPSGPGACCLGGVSGCRAETAEECGFLGGTFFGGGSQCSEVDCSTVYGACCTAPLVGMCLYPATEELCAFMGFSSVFYGAGTTCDDVTDCTPGACCIGGSCFQITEFECAGLGEFLGIGVGCAGNPCD